MITCTLKILQLMSYLAMARNFTKNNAPVNVRVNIIWISGISMLKAHNKLSLSPALNHISQIYLHDTRKSASTKILQKNVSLSNPLSRKQDIILWRAKQQSDKNTMGTN